MPVEEDQTGRQPVIDDDRTSAIDGKLRASDTDRLVDALTSGFSDLIKEQKELRKEFESLRPPSATTDKKTNFWTAYMKVADEHDKEFQQRYSTELDVALIFAGLFSAVSSAFIILIQPQLTPDAPTNIVAVQGLLYTSLFTTLLAALLAVLGKQWVMHYQAAGSRGTIAERGLERQRKLDGLRKWGLDAVLQMFPLLLQLALFLFSTGLSIYLWPVHRSIAGVVIGLTGFGFGFYILFLASAAVFPDSPFQTPLASFLRQIGQGIGVLYSQVRMLFRRVGRLPCVEAFRTAFMRVRDVERLLARSDRSRTRLPLFGQQKSTDIETPAHPMFFDKPSAEVPAVVWLLEASTDPVVITAAAAMAADLQWPLDLNLAPAMWRLRYIMIPFPRDDQDPTVDGLTFNRWIDCARAYCILKHIACAAGDSGLRWQGYWTRTGLKNAAHTENRELELTHLTHILEGWPDFFHPQATPSVDERALYIIPTFNVLSRFPSGQVTLNYFLNQIPTENVPSLRQPTFVDYLCCVVSFLSPVIPRVLVQRDKRRFCVYLLIQLFKVLQTQIITRDRLLVSKLIKTTAQLANRSEWIERSDSFIGAPSELGILSHEISRFCWIFGHEEDSLPVLASAATLLAFARNVSVQTGVLDFRDSLDAQTTEWIFHALEHVRNNNPQVSGHNAKQWDSTTTHAVQGLLQLLACADVATNSLPHPSPACLQIILQVLFIHRDAVSPLVFIILCKAPHWFCNPNLQRVLRSCSLWRQLGRLALKLQSSLTYKYLQLGNHIQADIPDWKPDIRADLSTWLLAFIPRYFPGNNSGEEEFISVMRSVWLPDCERILDRKSESWILAVTALVSVWETFDLREQSLYAEWLGLMHCTVLVSLRSNYFHREKSHTQAHSRNNAPIPRSVRTIYSSQLGESLLNAARTARNAVPTTEVPTTHVFGRTADLMGALGQKLSTEFEPTRGQVVLGGVAKVYGNWVELGNFFQEELGILERINISHMCCPQ
ncbi:hypothetical protein C8R47DRAFT_537305 [Mycena vitilis]|nr:hypothetical protein C8R47DRAFT_537305 [Mycena vitilis]